jgi:hypothetical protein
MPLVLLSARWAHYGLREFRSMWVRKMAGSWGIRLKHAGDFWKFRLVMLEKECLYTICLYVIGLYVQCLYVLLRCLNGNLSCSGGPWRLLSLMLFLVVGYQNTVMILGYYLGAAAGAVDPCDAAHVLAPHQVYPLLLQPVASHCDIQICVALLKMWLPLHVYVSRGAGSLSA